MRRNVLGGVAAAVVLLAPACTQIDNTLAKVPIFAFLRSAPSFDPYEHPLPAPPGSVPFESPNGEVLPALEGTEQALNAFAASPLAQNPFDASDPAALALGQTMFERHCFVCHGMQGLGDGPIIGPDKFVITPPSLVAAPATTRSDGYLYGIIRAGRGLMPAYGPRMTHEERWAIVTYVNSLQAAAGAPQAPQPQPSGAAAPADTMPGAAAQTDNVPAQQ